MEQREDIIRIFSKDIRNILKQAEVDFGKVQEIRLRVQSPLLIICSNQEYYLTTEGKKTEAAAECRKQAYEVTRADLKETLEYVSSYSLYAFEEEIRQGYLTIQGGHRVGVAGKTIAEGNGIRSMKFISCMNVRLSHQIKGCADPVMPCIYQNGQLENVLIVSPPRCGKTTLLRDLIRQVSDGWKIAGSGGSEVWIPPMTVGVVDERSEIGACFQGVPQNDLGSRTDILDCCPKALGMMMLIRSMSPQVVAVDEIGSREDLEALEYVMNCGCRVMATVHGTSLEDVRMKPVLGKMVEEGWFDRYILLGSRGRAGHLECICDSRGKVLYGKDSRETRREI